VIAEHLGSTDKAKVPALWPEESGSGGRRSLDPGDRVAPALRRTGRVTDLGADQFTRHVNSEVKKRNHIRQLEALGYDVTLSPDA
jgi:hypothetical protein